MYNNNNILLFIQLVLVHVCILFYLKSYIYRTKVMLQVHIPVIVTVPVEWT